MFTFCLLLITYFDSVFSQNDKYFRNFIAISPNLFFPGKFPRISIYLCIYPSNYLSIYLSFHPSNYPSIYLCLHSNVIWVQLTFCFLVCFCFSYPTDEDYVFNRNVSGFICPFLGFVPISISFLPIHLSIYSSI